MVPHGFTPCKGKALAALLALAIVSLCGWMNSLQAQNYATPYTFTTLAGRAYSGANDGTGSYPQFGYIQGMAVDSSGNIFVADSANCPNYHLMGPKVG